MIARTTAAVALVAALCAGAHLAAAAPPDGIQVRQHGHGISFSDADGMTLYTYAKDNGPSSACAGACATGAPPLLAGSDAKVEDEDWTTVPRENGATQWAYRGKPLYRSVRDMHPGDANGEDVNGLWRIAFRPIPLPPGVSIMRTLVGYVLANGEGLTLYALDKDKLDGSACDIACLRTWLPALAPGMAHPIGDWKLATRTDGTHQWTFRGRPLYRNADELHAADVVTGVSGWHPIVLEPLPPLPSWIVVQESDAGELLADPKGRTLYTFNDERRIKEGPPHIPPEWVPLDADTSAAGFGGWAVTDYLGHHQWAYGGLPLYINKLDTRPGDILGIRSGDPRFATIMRSGNSMQGTGR